MQSDVKTVADYLKELPPEKRAVITVVRKLILDHLPAGYVERMNWGMISYEIPLEMYPDTYNGKPLLFASLAAQKKHFALYLMNVYQDPSLEDVLKRGFARAGKKLDMGKSCLRFRRLEDLPMQVIGEVIAATPPESMIERAKEVQSRK
ncbi:MAG: DUF1801 domain-containing protein [Anaerolineales bacterium]